MNSRIKQFEGGVFEDTAGVSLRRVEQRKRNVEVFGGIEDGGSMMRRLSVLPGTGSGSLLVCIATNDGLPTAILQRCRCRPLRVAKEGLHHAIRRKTRSNSDPAGQNAGIRLDSLIAWTINDKDEMACLTQMGVSGIITG